MALLKNFAERDGSVFPLQKTEQFTRILQLGYFVFIFDRFDELTKSGDPDADAVLSRQKNMDWLDDLARHSDARIMLTTRPSFWRRKIVPMHNRCVIFCLEQFSEENVDGYFRAHFPDNDDLPSCAVMIANHIERGATTPIGELISGESDKYDPAKELFMQILERENIRQSMGVKKIEELQQKFEEIAALCDEKFELADIGIFLEEIMDDIKKVEDHAFIEKDGGGKRYVFKNELLRLYLQMSCINRLIEKERLLDHYDVYKAFKDLIKSQSDGKDVLIDQVARLLSDYAQIAKAHNACAHMIDGIKERHHLKSFLFHIISKKIAGETAADSKERGDKLMGLFASDNSRQVNNLYVRGGLEKEIRIDDWAIHDSIVNDFSMNKDGNISFIGCEFSVDTLPNKKSRYSAGQSKNNALNALMDALAGKEIDHKGNLQMALKRFWLGRLRHEVVTRVVWKRGKTATMEEIYKGGMLAVLEREKLVEERDDHDGRLDLGRDARGEIRDFMENALIGPRIKKALDQLAKIAK